MVRWHEVTGTPNVLSGSMDIFKAPLVADPGTRYEYGINTDWLGRVVEAAGGLSLRDHLAEHILGPLGMTSTTFLMDDAQRANCVPIHLRGEDGAWAASDIDWSQEPEWWAGGHGLYSTPSDYMRFQRMLLGGGTLDGAKILERATVEAAFRNQIGELDFPELISDRGPGLERRLRGRPRLQVGPRAAAQHGGRAGHARGRQRRLGGPVQHPLLGRPRAGVTGAIYMQSLPFAEPRVFALYPAFERALYASLAEEPVQRRFTREGAPVGAGGLSRARPGTGPT